MVGIFSSLLFSSYGSGEGGKGMGHSPYSADWMSGFLSAPPSPFQHQQQVVQAVERAKQVTMAELNMAIGVCGCRFVSIDASFPHTAENSHPCLVASFKYMKVNSFQKRFPSPSILILC